MDSSDDTIIRRKFGENTPSVTDLSKNIGVMLVNTHYSLNGAKPLSPKVVEIGGAHIKEAEPIEKVKNCLIFIFKRHKVMSKQVYASFDLKIT